MSVFVSPVAILATGILVGLAALFVPRRAGAQDALSLSLEQAIARAAEQGPAVTYGRHALRDAEARRVGAGIVMPMNPRVAGEARPALGPAGGGDRSALGFAATVDALFEVGGAPAARVNEADRGIDVARADLDVARFDARTRAGVAYVRARIADDQVQDANNAVTLAQRVLTASNARSDAGAAGDIERTLASSELALLEAGAAAANRERTGRLMELREALDLPAATALTLTTNLDAPPAASPVEALVQRAVADHVDLRTIRRRITAWEALETRLAREVFPRVGGLLGVDASPQSPVFGMIGVSVELPFPQRNQGPRARAAAGRSAELERLDLERRRLVRAIYVAHAGYEARRAELATLADTALPAAERTLGLVDVGWRAGRFDIFRVTSAARDVQRLRALRREAAEAAWTARIVLDRVTGGTDR